MGVLLKHILYSKNNISRRNFFENSFMLHKLVKKLCLKHKDAIIMRTKEMKRQTGGCIYVAVELKELYAKISPQYDVKLHTTGCFEKMIGWVHMVEDPEFAELLHGDELIFNSGLNYTSDEWLRRFGEALNKVHAGGLIVSLWGTRTISQEIIDYCNKIKFPLFSASWKTPYIDIMRMFSVILLKNEQRETNLIAALKNAIYYPENEELYLSHFERNGFFRDMSYTIVILSCHAYDTDNGNERLLRIEKSLHYILKNVIVYEEKGCLIILAAGYSLSKIRSDFQRLCQRDSNIYVGIGTTADQIRDIHKSYHNANTAYQLTKTAIPKNLLDYDELGIYKILADVKEVSIYPAFVKETLGALIDYDKQNHKEYMKILDEYFRNDCSVIETSKALYCHKNTLTYKIHKIRDILGYDIHSNENRTKIMIALYIMRLGEIGI